MRAAPTEIAYWVIEVAMLVMALRSRRHALMALAFSIPISSALPALPLPLLNYQNFLMITVLVSFGIHPPEKGVTGARIRLWVPLAVLGVLLTASFFNTVFTFTPALFWRLWDPYRNAQAFRAAMACLLTYALAATGVRSRDDILAALRAGVAGVVFESCYAMVEYLFLHPARVTGHMGQPNSMGSYLGGSVALLAALLMGFGLRHPWGRLAAFGLLFAITGLVGTLSRGAWAAAVAGFTVAGAGFNRRVLAGGLLLLLFSSFWLPNAALERLEGMLVSEADETYRFRRGKAGAESALIAMINEELEEAAAAGEIDEADTRLDPSIQARLVVWTAAFHMMVDQPFGVGFGVFPWNLQYYSSVLRFKAPHSTYIKVGTEMGVLALGLIVYLFAAFLREGWRVGRTHPDTEIRALGMGLFAYATAFIVHALAVDQIFQFDVSGQFWLFMGVLMQIRILQPETRTGPEEAPAEASRASGPRPLYELVR